MPGCASVKLTTNYRSHRAIVERYDRWMASADWSNPRGAPFRYDKTIEADRDGAHPDYPAVIAHLGQGRARRGRPLRRPCRVPQDATRSSRTTARWPCSCTACARTTAARTSPRWRRKGIPAFCPRARAYFENDGGPRLWSPASPCSSAGTATGAARSAGAVAELAAYVDDAIVELGRRFGAPHPLAAALQRVDRRDRGASGGRSARPAPGRLLLPPARARPVRRARSRTRTPRATSRSSPSS